MTLKHFASDGDVLEYIKDEILATLEDDLRDIETSTSYDARVGLELSNKIHDIKQILGRIRLTLKEPVHNEAE